MAESILIEISTMLALRTSFRSQITDQSTNMLEFYQLGSRQTSLVFKVHSTDRQSQTSNEIERGAKYCDF